MTAGTKLVLALLGIAFLLLNPAGICVGTPPSQTPTHPCCPSSSNHHGTSETGACICIDRPAVPADLPSPDGHLVGFVAATQPSLAVPFRSEITFVADSSGFTLETRYLAFHQLLV